MMKRQAKIAATVNGIAKRTAVTLSYRLYITLVLTFCLKSKFNNTDPYLYAAGTA